MKDSSDQGSGYAKAIAAFEDSNGNRTAAQFFRLLAEMIERLDDCGPAPTVMAELAAASDDALVALIDAVATAHTVGMMAHRVLMNSAQELPSEACDRFARAFRQVADSANADDLIARSARE